MPGLMTSKGLAPSANQNRIREEEFDDFCSRWAPTSYKWSYNPYKWPYNWVTGVITPLMEVITPLITSRGPTLVGYFLIFRLQVSRSELSDFQSLNKFTWVKGDMSDVSCMSWLMFNGS